MVLAQACYLPPSLFLHLKICLFNMSGKFLPPFPLLAVWYFSVIKAPTYRVRSNGQSRSSKLQTFTFRTGHYYCLYVQCFCIYSTLFVLDGLFIGNPTFSIATTKLILGSLWGWKLYWRLCGVLFKPPYWIFADN